ncbi:MAG TPA: outer membrane protein assembly factor BamD [Candidatus Cloacimonetes bacterium]|nr:outer membrane protein assembly factor BamD [Candidatus Cloacimonadota bacterium]HEX38178.1 outer membrane protein assembly factor BamD [Candidatus Cloacimonadota bacterium]
MKKILGLSILLVLAWTLTLSAQSLSKVYRYIDDENFAEATILLKEHLNSCTDPKIQAEIYYLLGQCADNANDAVHNYKKVLNIPDNNYYDRALIHLAKIAMTHQDWLKAKEYSDKLLSKTFSLYYSDALFINAQAHFCNNEYFPSITAFKEFINISLDSSRRELAYLNCGTAYYELQQYSKAIDQLKQLQTDNPTTNFMPYVLYMLGLCYEKKEDYKEAINYYKKLTNDYPYSQYTPLAEQQIVSLIELGYYSSSLTTLPQIEELLNKKFIVQLAAFDSSTQAYKSKDEFEGLGISGVFIFTKSVNGKIYYALGLGPYSTEDEAQFKKLKLKDQGISSFIYKKP